MCDDAMSGRVQNTKPMIPMSGTASARWQYKKHVWKYVVSRASTFKFISISINQCKLHIKIRFLFGEEVIQGQKMILCLCFNKRATGLSAGAQFGRNNMMCFE